MIIPVILIAATVGLTLTLALYAGFIPYFSLLNDIKNYNMAYYGANTAIERSLLVLRYRGPGFQGKGGRTGGVVNEGLGPVSDYLPLNFGNFGPGTSLYWDIDGRSVNGEIPGSGNNMLEYQFRDGNINYGVLGYNETLIIPLAVDSTISTSAYTTTNSLQPSLGGIELAFRTNAIIGSGFIINSDPETAQLCEECPESSIGIGDRDLLDWVLRGTASDGTDYTILPRNAVGYINDDPNTPASVFSYDELIRAGDINAMTNDTRRKISINQQINPLYNTDPSVRLRPPGDQLTGHLMIGDTHISSDLSSPLLSVSTFKNIIQQTIDPQLEFSLKGLLTTQAGNIYPFLQYQAQLLNDADVVSQPFFALKGVSKVGQYTVQISAIKKLENNFLSSFTVIF